MSTPEPQKEALGNRHVRALPVVAFTVLCATVSLVFLSERWRPEEPAHTPQLRRQANEPAPVRDEDHYVAGSPPAVCERFLRAWMRGRYDEAMGLSVGELRTKAQRHIATIGTFSHDEMEALRQTRVYVEAAHFDLEHVEQHELPPSPEGHPRKEVKGQAHATGEFEGVKIDSRRGQSFVVELVDGAWRVAERTWERFDDPRMEEASLGSREEPVPSTTQTPTDASVSEAQP